MAPAEKKDSGSYVCVATNTVGVRESRAARLSVLGETAWLWGGGCSCWGSCGSTPPSTGDPQKLWLPPDEIATLEGFSFFPSFFFGWNQWC